MSAETAPPRILLAEPALLAATAAANSSRRETGGVLLGFRAGNDVCVTDLVEVRAAAATATRYASTEADRNAAIASFQNTQPSESPIGYVGTWHSHLGTSKASPIDRRTLRTEATDAPDLIAMLLLLKTRGSWLPEGYVAHHIKMLEHRRTHRIFRREPWVTPAQVVMVT